MTARRPGREPGRPLQEDSMTPDQTNDAPTELDHLAEIVDGQGRVEWCGCGEPMTEYEGEWLHVYNPALTGADDHDASP